ncbi:MAG TPA: hypothetical protein VJH67_02405 [Candidatus Paceibacterota bacterium]
MPATISASEKLQETILLLAYWSKRAKEEEGITTSVVMVTQLPTGMGVVNVYQNGDLQETPLAIATVADEVARKALRFASEMAGIGGIKPVSV